jgi:hypothetical protein
LIKKDVSMNRFGLAVSVVIVLSFIAGCTSGTYNLATVYQQEAGDGYCHKKLQPIGRSDVGTPIQARGDDYIDYYGPCDGPTVAEQIRKQRRFEQFRFGRDYMDEG